MGPNCYINTGVRDLEVALFKATVILPEKMAFSSNNLLNLPIYAEINKDNLDRILHSTYLLCIQQKYSHTALIQRPSALYFS